VGCESLGIRVVDVRHEATTVFAADAVSRLTGVPGVAVVTAGPGLTNTMTAVKNAQLAQSPLVLLAGATAMILKGRGSLQDIDQLALMRSAVKKSWSIPSVREIIPTIRAAFRVAQEGVPGPVFVEFPIEILWPEQIIASQIGVKAVTQPLQFTKQSIMEHVKAFYLNRHLKNVFHDGFAPVVPLSEAQLRVATLPVDRNALLRVHRELVQHARAPVILIGSQAIKAGPPPRVGSSDPVATSGPSHVADLKVALERLGVPVFLSGMARGLLGAQHPLLLRHNRSKILRKADAVLLVGVPQDFRLDYGSHINPRARYFTVNLCAETLAKNTDIRSPDARIHSDPLDFVKALAALQPAPRAAAAAAEATSTTTTAPVTARRSEWFSFVQGEQASREQEIDRMAAKEAQHKADGFVNPLRLCRIIDEVLPAATRIVADGGDFVGTASYTVKPRQPLSWLDPGVFGTLGVGAGFALAAKLVFPSESVVILYGDGASGYGLIEFDTYVRLRVPVIAVVGNDACWSQMYRDQIRMLKSAVATELAFTHYEKVAEGMGAKGILVRAEEEMAPAMRQAIEWSNQGHPVLINCMIAKSGFREGSISL